MVEFAGYSMPVSYTGINDEHAAVRNNAGVFDVSHMGEFILKGANALDLLQRVTTNDVSKLTAGKAQYSCLTNETGGIVDDLLVYCIEDNKVYMIVVNASNIEKDWDWIVQHNNKDVELHNISDKTCLLAIQGPNATKILQPLTEMDILNLKYYTFSKGNSLVLTTCLSVQQDIRVPEELRSISKTRMTTPIRSGIQFLKPASPRD
jgi:aminomethyltransferase